MAKVIPGLASIPATSVVQWISPNNSGKISAATMAVATLNTTCAAATRFALEVAPIDANIAVEVVPIFAPITIAPAA